MQLTQWLLIAIVVIPLGFVLANRLRIDLAAMIMATLLGLAQFAGFGMLGQANTPQDAIKAISGFSQTVVITLISLFALARGLEKSGVTNLIARQIVRFGGKNSGRLIFMFSAITALLSLFMNNLAAGALVLPSAMEVARRTGIKPSKLLIPVAYGSLLGGSATYFTTANIIMSDLLRIAHPPQAALNILDFTPTGGLIAIAGILFLWALGDRLLPNREPAAEQLAARRTSKELETFYQIGERLWEARVKPGSTLAGQLMEETEIGKSWGVTVAVIRRGPEEWVLPAPGQRIHSGDLLLLIGREEKVLQLQPLGLDICPPEKETHLSTQKLALVEMILAPHSEWEGKTLKEISLRQRFGLTAIALKRLTRSYRTDIGNIPLAMGDSLLAIGYRDQFQTVKKSSNILVFEPSTSDQPVDLQQAVPTVAIILAAIGAAIAGAPVFLSVLFGAILILLLNVITVEEVYRSIEWQAIFLIAGMYAVSLAMVQTGLAGMLGKSLLDLVTPFGPLGLAGGAYLLTAILTQFMGGQVSALVTGPVVISAALSTGVNPQAVAVATAIGCSASFFTPLAHPVNILMIAPANYKFSDFLRAGWLLTLLSFLMLLVGLSLFWKL
jgi:di/tricarboxylate transporter